MRKVGTIYDLSELHGDVLEADIFLEFIKSRGLRLAECAEPHTYNLGKPDYLINDPTSGDVFDYDGYIILRASWPEPNDRSLAGKLFVFDGTRLEQVVKEYRSQKAASASDSSPARNEQAAGSPSV